MNKEAVVINLDGAPSAYREYIEMRNKNIALDIANFLGIPFRDMQKEGGNYYVVPAVTLDSQKANKLRIGSEMDFYGGRVDHIAQAGKSILHGSVSQNRPDFYKAEFAERVWDCVLSGITGFSKEDMIRGYQELADRGIEARLKLPDESDGNGQYVVRNMRHLSQILRDLDDRCIEEHGLALEANVLRPRTLSVGFAKIGDEVFGFSLRQKDEQVSVGDSMKTRYKGCEVRVVRGGVEALTDMVGLGNDERNAIYCSIRFIREYMKSYKVIASRLSVDYVCGENRNGEVVGGVTDVTARLGGTCPGLMVAVGEFRRDETRKEVKAEVTLNYKPSEWLAEEKGAKIYLNSYGLRVSARKVED